MDKKYSFTIGMLPLAALCLALAGCHQSQQSDIAEASRNVDNGQYRTAVIQLKNLLKAHPNNGEAWLTLGRASLMLGSPADAESELRKAEKNGVPKHKLAIPLARALLVQGKGEKLLTEIKPNVVHGKADRARLLVIRGDAFLASDKPGQAEKSYQAALTAAPDSANAQVGLAKVAMVKKDPDSAQSLLEKVKRNHPDNARAWLLTARMDAAAKQYAEAEQALTRALEGRDGDLLPQQAFMARSRLAEVQIRQNKLSQALEQLKALNKASPDQPYANYLRALVAYKLKNYKIAESRLQRVLRVSPSSVSAQLLIGAVDFAQGRYSQAQMHLSNVIGIDPQNEKARKLLALTLYKSGQTQQAIKVARPVVDDDYSDAEVLAALSSSSPGPNSDVIPSGSEPATTAESLQFARRYIRSGKTRSAIALLEKLPDEDEGGETDFQRDRLLVIALLRQGDIDKALNKAHALVKAHPEAAESRLTLGGALTVAGKHDAARKEFKHALKINPHGKLARMSLAMLALKGGDYESAKGYYQTVLDRHEDSVGAMLGIARAEDRRGHSDNALKWVEKARAANANALRPRLLLVRYYTHNGNKKQALDIAREASKIAPDNPVVLNSLGIARFNAGDRDAGVESFKVAVKNAPKSAQYRINLARAEIAVGQMQAASDELKKVVDRHPDNIGAVSLYALTRLKSGDTAQAIDLATGLRQSHPVQAYVLEGDLHMFGKHFGEAGDAYRHAFKQKPSRSVAAKGLAAASAGNRDGADKMALTWLESHPDDAALRADLGSYYMKLNHNDKAMRQYQRVIKQYPNNVAVLNNMAWLYTLKGNEKAVELAEKAHEIAPEAAQITDTLGWALVRTGNADRAVGLLRKAVKQTPDSAPMRYHLAAALARTGDEKEASDLLKKLLQSKQQFAARDDAEKLYAGLK